MPYSRASSCTLVPWAKCRQTESTGFVELRALGVVSLGDVLSSGSHVGAACYSRAISRGKHKRLDCGSHFYLEGWRAWS